MKQYHECHSCGHTEFLTFAPDECNACGARQCYLDCVSPNDWDEYYESQFEMPAGYTRPSDSETNGIICAYLTARYKGLSRQESTKAALKFWDSVEAGELVIDVAGEQLPGATLW